MNGGYRRCAESFHTLEICTSIATALSSESLRFHSYSCSLYLFEYFLFWSSWREKSAFRHVWKVELPTLFDSGLGTDYWHHASTTHATVKSIVCIHWQQLLHNIRVYIKERCITCFSCVIIDVVHAAIAAVSCRDRTDNVPFHEWRFKKAGPNKKKTLNWMRKDNKEAIGNFLWLAIFSVNTLQSIFRFNNRVLLQMADTGILSDFYAVIICRHTGIIALFLCPFISNFWYWEDRASDDNLLFETNALSRIASQRHHLGAKHFLWWLDKREGKSENDSRLL